MLSASRWQPHLLHVSAVDHRQIWSMDKSWLCVTLSGFLQSHSSLSVKPHFLWHALQWPWPVRKRFSSDVDIWSWPDGARDEAHRGMQLGIYKANVCGTLPHWATVFCHRVTQSQRRWSQGISVGTPRGSSKLLTQNQLCSSRSRNLLL